MSNFNDWVYNNKTSEPDLNTRIQIKKAQEFTFEKALEINFNSWRAAINRCIRDINEFPLKRDFIKNEIAGIEDLMAQNRKAFSQSFLSRSFDNITGPDFQLVKLRIESIELNIPEKDKLNFRMHLAKKQLEYLKTKGIGTLSHRQEAIILFFKVLANDEPLPTRKELREIAKNREIAFFNLYSENSPNHKDIEHHEIEAILPSLQDFPNALKIAQDKLKQLE